MIHHPSAVDCVASLLPRLGMAEATPLPTSVADDFHRFYHHHRVLESESQAFRLALVQAAQTVIARSLDLVGVEAPERM